MKYSEIDIKVAQSKNAKLVMYVQEDYPETYGDRYRPMILVCPGGGYQYTSVREGEPIALQFLSMGCHAAVLRYDCAGEGAKFPQHILELAASVSYIRNHADEYKIDKEKIVVAGFSAGGHLAASLGCFWHEEWLERLMCKYNGTKKEHYKPNGLILAYPVITSGEFAHRGSFDSVIGDNPNKEDLLEKLSLEKNVTDNVPPVFMWHTFEDGSVPLENSLLFAGSLRRAGVSLEYHVFPHGGHGYALGTKETAIVPDLKEIDPQIPQWIELCHKWIENVIL